METSKCVFPRLHKQFKKILVVEDEPCLQNAIYRSIRKINPQSKVIWVERAEDAIDLIADHQLDLIISDHFLAGEMRGMELWEKCLQVAPNLPFVLVSALTKREVENMAIGIIEGPPPLLSKPFTKLDFQIMLEEYL